MAKRPRSRASEYRLTVLPHLNDRTFEPTTLVTLETAQAFAAFRYDLTVEEKRTGDSLTYRVLGLKTPSLSLPSSGPARFVREYEDLKGTVQITVIGLDGGKSTCTLRIGPKKIDLVRPPTGGTVKVTTKLPAKE